MLKDWEVGEYRDAILFGSPASIARSYLVRGSRVVAYSPAWMNVEEAYDELG